MSAKKPNKNGGVLIECEICHCVMKPKDLEDHIASKDCSSSVKKRSYPYLLNGIMYGTLSIVANEDNPKDGEVFLSDTVMDLCNITVGCAVAVKSLETDLTFIKFARPSKDKHLMSIQLNKLDLRKTFCKDNISVSVRKAVHNYRKAQKVTVACLNFNGSNYDDTYLEGFLSKNLRNSVIKVGLRFPLCYFGETYRFEIKCVESRKECDDENLESKMNGLIIDDVDDDFCQVTGRTQWQCYRNKADFEKEANEIGIATKIGALDEQMFRIRRLIDKAFGKVEESSCGVLLHGFPGTGKSLMVKVLAEESRINIVELTFDQISDQFRDYSKINKNHLYGNKPTVILLDKFEQISPSKSSLNRDERVVEQGLMNLFSLIHERSDHKVFVIAITNKLDLVSHTFRKFPFLYPEIEVPIPNPEGRLDILKKLVENLDNLVIKLSAGELQEIANSTHGYVGLDLQCLWLAVLDKADNKEVNFKMVKTVLSTFKPQAMRDSNLKVPNVKWSDIGGQEKLKKTLRLAIEMPFKYKDKIKLFGLEPLKGVLMFGPPGCSKTMVGKAMATESGLNFFSVNGSELYSKWVGDSERAVKEIFRKARQVAPSVIFFDEFDALGAERSTEASSNVQDRVLSQLLTELDGVHSTNDVIVIAATNRPEKIDKSLLRPGRFDRIVYVPLPDSNTRRDIFRIKLHNRPVENVDVEYLVQHTENYSGAEINEIYSMAATMALEEDCDVIQFRHFTEALELITPMTSPNLLKIYEDFKCYCR